MSANTQPLFELTPVNAGVQLTSANTTAKVTLYTGDTNGTRIDGISCCTSDTSAVDLNFYLYDGTTSHYLGVVALAAGSGYTTVPRVDAIATIAAAALGFLVLKPGYVLQVACNATMTSDKVTDVVALGGSY
jgi:hypothetical protein